MIDRCIEPTRASGVTRLPVDVSSAGTDEPATTSRHRVADHSVPHGGCPRQRARGGRVQRPRVGVAAPRPARPPPDARGGGGEQPPDGASLQTEILLPRTAPAPPPARGAPARR